MNYILKGIQVPVSKRVPNDPSHPWGRHTIPDGCLIGDLEVKIDERFIRERLAPRALRSKGKRCISGPVTVKVLHSKHEPEATK